MASEEFRQLLVRLEAARPIAGAAGDDLTAMRAGMEARAFRTTEATAERPDGRGLLGESAAPARK